MPGRGGIIIIGAPEQKLMSHDVKYYGYILPTYLDILLDKLYFVSMHEYLCIFSSIYSFI